MAEIQPASYLDVVGVRLHYERSGEPRADRPTLVLVHGFGASHQSWHDVFPILAKYHTTVRVDLKGFGFSDKPDDHNYRPDDQAALLAEFIQKLPDQRVILVGHSYGGGVALKAYFSLKNSGREPVQVVGLVLADAAVFAQDFPFFVSYLRNPWTSFIIESFSTPEWRTQYVLKRIFVDQNSVTTARIHRYAYFLRLNGAERALRRGAEQIDLSDSEEITRRLDTIKVPVLLIWGENDPVISVEHGRTLVSRLPQAELHILPKTGHVPHEERPEQTVQILDVFLKRFEK